MARRLGTGSSTVVQDTCLLRSQGSETTTPLRPQGSRDVLKPEPSEGPTRDASEWYVDDLILDLSVVTCDSVDGIRPDTFREFYRKMYTL